MNNSHNKILFRPKRLSQSNSRQKYAPYRQHSPINKRTQSQNQQKMTLQEPIIRIKSLIDGGSQKTKLKLNKEVIKEPENRYLNHYSNYFYNQSQGKNDENYQKLLERIDYQTEFIKKGFSEINQQIKLPKLKIEQNRQQRGEQEQIEHRLQIYIQEINRVNKENMLLRTQIADYQQQINKLQEELQYSHKQCAQLIEQIAIIKLLNVIDFEEDRQAHIDPYQPTQSIVQVQTGFELFGNFKTEEGKKKGRNQNRQGSILIQEQEKQIDNLKTKNQILSQEVKLLNYNLEEIERKNTVMEKMSEKAVSQSVQKQRSISRSELRSNSSSKIKKQISNPSMLTNEQRQRSIVNSIDLSYMHVLKHAVPSSIAKRKAVRNTTAICFQNKIYEEEEDNLGKSQRMFGMSKAKSVLDQTKIDKGKLFLHDKAKVNLKRTFHHDSELKSTIPLWTFNKSNFDTLELITTTLSYKFKGFRYRSQDLQDFFINRTNPTISQQQIRQYLADFPFLLSSHFIEELIRYLFRYEQDRSKLSIDRMYNFIRQIAPAQELLDDQIQKAVMQRIRIILLQNQDPILSELQMYGQQPGIIDLKTFLTVLEQYNFNKNELDLIICQCCIVSIDFQHLNYRNYLEILRQSHQTQDA